jgi:hypothetical protein
VVEEPAGPRQGWYRRVTLLRSRHAQPRPRAGVDDAKAAGGARRSIAGALAPHEFVRRQPVPTRLAEGEVVMHRLTKIVPGDPEVLMLGVIEVRAGATERAWQTRIDAEWEGHAVTVVSREGLIELKRLRGSPQDLADITLLEERG